MAFTNYDTKEINCKIVYCGPESAGKTANLRSIFSCTSAEVVSGLMEFEESPESTPFFDFLPISLGQINDYHLKLHLYTVTKNPAYETVNSVILKGLDGYVFVADSRIESMIDNLRSLQNWHNLLEREGISHANLPCVVQYNKRDLKEIVPIEILRQELNGRGAVDHHAVATDSKGTMETLQSMARLVLEQLTP